MPRLSHDAVAESIAQMAEDAMPIVAEENILNFTERDLVDYYTPDEYWGYERQITPEEEAALQARQIEAFRANWEPYGSFQAFVAAHPQGWAWSNDRGDLWLEPPASFYIDGRHPY